MQLEELDRENEPQVLGPGSECCAEDIIVGLSSCRRAGKREFQVDAKDLH